MTRRAPGSVIIILSILFLPYWVYVPILFVAIIYFPFFWEGILLAFLVDVIHGSGIGTLFLLFSPLALSILIALVILLPFRERLRFYV